MIEWLIAKWKDITGIASLEASVSTLTAKVSAQNDILYQVSKSKLQLAEEKIALQKKYDEALDVANVLNVRITELGLVIESLKTEIAANGIDLPAAKPAFIGSGYCYRPNIQVEGEDISVQDPTNVYTRSDLLNKSIRSQDLKKLNKYQKLMKIWEFTINALTYKWDTRDNHQLHPITILRKFGDCEDGTILFIDACRACGISATDAFNHVGNTSFGYHSYPTVFLDDADIKGTPCEQTGKGFYIYETTLDFVPSAPKKLNGSQYWSEGGIQNWAFFGSIKPESASLFNGIAMPKTGAGDIRELKVEDGEDKRKAINDYWKKSEKRR